VDGEHLIMALDHNPNNLDLISRFLAKEGYRTLEINTLKELDEALDRGLAIDMALLDLAGYDQSIWDRCERLRKAGIPFLIISARQSTATRQESLTHGAWGILVKPLVAKELMSLIRSML
jgi:DNA-binding response OmpR family regulator